MNVLLILTLIVLLWKIRDGYKKGMVKEIISFITLLITCAVVALVMSALKSYMEKEFLGIIIAVVLLALVCVIHHILDLIFFSAKILSKLPVVHWVDKLLGMVVGALETVVYLWTLYLLIMNLGLGMVGQQILTYVEQNQILSWLYRYNLLAVLLENILK